MLLLGTGRSHSATKALTGTMLAAAVLVSPAAHAAFTLTPAPSAAPPPAPSGQAKIPEHTVSGFGDRIPLIVAATQIIPAPLLAEFDGNVSPNIPISWNGARPWQDTLRAALSPAGLAYHIDGNRVVIGQTAAVASVPSPPQPPRPQSPVNLAPTAQEPLTTLANITAAVGDHPLQQTDHVNATETMAISISADEQPLSSSSPMPLCAQPNGAGGPIWTTTPGLTFVAQAERWAASTNGQYFVAPPTTGAPPAPNWRIQVPASCQGTILDALTFLRDGFPFDPKPDIEVTRNKVVLIRQLGGGI